MFFEGVPAVLRNRAICWDSTYFVGEGVAQDRYEAFNWATLAAKQGFAAAQYNLGHMYDIGEGVAENNAEAVRWYLFAAEQGDEDAQLVLGQMYYDAEGVFRKVWMSRSGGIRVRRNRDMRKHSSSSV